jgi:hypothetical protein
VELGLSRGSAVVVVVAAATVAVVAGFGVGLGSAVELAGSVASEAAAAVVVVAVVAAVVAAAAVVVVVVVVAAAAAAVAAIDAVAVAPPGFELVASAFCSGTLALARTVAYSFHGKSRSDAAGVSAVGKIGQWH